MLTLNIKLVFIASHLLRFSVFRKPTQNFDTENSRTQWLTLQVVRYEGTSPRDYNPTLWLLVILYYFNFRDSVAPYFQILWRFRKIAKNDYCFVMSVPSVWLFVCPSFPMEHLAHIRRIFMKWGVWAFFENISMKFKGYYDLTLVTGTLHEDVRTFMIVPG
jgi:hypothetical protein